MSTTATLAGETEPPSPIAMADARNTALVDRVCSTAHLPPSAHVAVIGHRTLPLLLEFLRRGYAALRSLRPGAPAPDCETADLVWIVDVRDDELDEALRAARLRAGRAGCVIVEGGTCDAATKLVSLRERARAKGLDLISFDAAASRLFLAATNRPALAA